MTQTVLITGASTGIGRATALLFQQKGWNVAASMRTPEKETELAALDRVSCPRLDVTDPDSIARAFRETLDRFGAMDVLVNNAGYMVFGPFEAATREQIKRQFDTNVLGLMEACRQALPLFRNQGRGILINVASIAGHLSFPMASLYHATKWAVEGFSESLFYEAAPFNIRVKLIEPGAIKTDFYTRSMDSADGESMAIYSDHFRRVVRQSDENLKRVADHPSKVAETIFRAATDGSKKLRYPTAGGARLMLAARNLLPDGIFLRAVKTVIDRG